MDFQGLPMIITKKSLTPGLEKRTQSYLICSDRPIYIFTNHLENTC